MLRNGSAALLRRATALLPSSSAAAMAAHEGCGGAALLQLLQQHQHQHQQQAVLMGGMRALLQQQHQLHTSCSTRQQQQPPMQRRHGGALTPHNNNDSAPAPALPQQQWRQLASDAAPAEAAAAGSGDGGLVIDASAVKRLKELQAERGAARLALRIEVEGGGCSGFQYRFRLEDGGDVGGDAAALQGSQGQQQGDADNDGGDEDIVFERDGAVVVVDAVSLGFLRGAVVEYEDSLMRSAFQIASNPNSESTCGCGTSFSAKF